MQPYAPQGMVPGVMHERPAGVATLAILQFIMGILAILGGVAVLAVMGSMSLDLAAAGEGIGGGLIFLGLIAFLLGWGLWNLKPWARTLSLIFAVLWVITGILTLIVGIGIVILIVAILILWYLMKPEIKAAFGAGVPMAYGMPAPMMGVSGPYVPQLPMATASVAPATSAAYCGQCGSPMPPGALACPSCGGR